MTRALVGLVVAASIVLVVACSESRDVFVGQDCALGFCDDSLPFDGDGEGGAPTPPTTVLACIGTECPAPYGTCSPTEPCAVNFMTDPLNCGACGVACPAVGDLNMRSACEDGVCRYRCIDGATYRDCNGLLDDGCEVRIADDPQNCGACGKKCPPGTPCIGGECGCLPPEVPCNGSCVNLESDHRNCGACGNVCGAHQPSPDECSPMPPNTAYGCSKGVCNRMMCDGPWGDCDGNAAQCDSNGCETRFDTVENCGGCGVKCAPDQECRLVSGSYECHDKCGKTGRVRCSDKDVDCTDLATDVDNCGACGAVCRGARANQVDRCVKGLCTIECKKGFADCNGDPSDGCEVDLSSDAEHCGGCGVRCEVGVGQPCIEGKCLMVDCETGAVTR